MGYDDETGDIGQENKHRDSFPDFWYTLGLGTIIAIEITIIILFIIFHPRPKPATRIVLGRPARIAEFPYHVKVSDIENSFLCGGTIITQNFVLSAAHCTYRLEGKQFVIAAGILNQNYIDYPSETLQLRNVTYHLAHPGFDLDKKYTVDDDILILYFREPLQFNKYVMPAYLPTRQTYVLGDCVLAGWGLRNYNCTMVFTDDLYAGYILIDHITEPPNFLVTRTPRRGVYTTQCQGDSGGGLMKKDIVHGHYTIVGIVSHRLYELCGDPYTPAKFTNVREYLVWIHNFMEDVKRKESQDDSGGTKSSGSDNKPDENATPGKFI